MNATWSLVPCGWIWVSKKLMIYVHFHALSPLGFTAKEKNSSVQQFCKRNYFIDKKSWKRIARRIQADIKSWHKKLKWPLFVTELYRRASLNARIQTLKQMHHSIRKPHRVPLMLDKNKKLGLQFSKEHKNWTI